MLTHYPNIKKCLKKKGFEFTIGHMGLNFIIYTLSKSQIIVLILTNAPTDHKF